MNKRHFFKTLATAAVGFSILPSALTYARTWKPAASSPLIVPNPSWFTAEYEVMLLCPPNVGLRVWITERSRNEQDRILARKCNVTEKQLPWINDPPIRYKLENGALRLVPQYIPA